MADNSDTKASLSGWSQPLRLHLSVVIVLLLLGISLPLMWLAYSQGTKSATQAAGEQMRLVSQRAIDRYRNILGDGFAAVTLAAATDGFLEEPPYGVDANSKFLTRALAGSPYIEGIYVGYPRGAFLHAVDVAANPQWIKAIDAPEGTAVAIRTIEIQEGGRKRSTWRFHDRDGRYLGERATEDVTYDPRERPWYKAASQAFAPVSVGPYVMATTKSIGLTLAAPMERVRWIVVGADIPLQSLSNLLAEESVSPRARGYVFDGQHRLIVDSDKARMNELIGTFGDEAGGRKVAELGGDPVLDAVRALLAGQAAVSPGTVRFAVAGEPYLAQISPIHVSDLVDSTVVIAAPLTDFTAGSDRVLRQNLLIFSLFLAAGMLAALGIARLATNALNKLTDDARQIGDLALNGQSAVRSYIEEINTLAGALGSARRAIGTFALYVPRELVRKIVASGQAVAGSAVRQEVTLLFTDIRDFTTISESRSPEEVVALLSNYFELMNVIVERHKGVIVQYLGDSIYAMWNAPEPDPDHVNDACRCALALNDGIDELNLANRARGLPELVTRFGLHTGEAVVGSVGARSRRQYTAMGDTVNVASRLEGINKEFGTTILVSSAVRERADLTFAFRALGKVRAKGRAEEIEVFELVGMTADVETSAPKEVSDASQQQIS
jgi:adenylate cyclase